MSKLKAIWRIILGDGKIKALWLILFAKNYFVVVDDISGVDTVCVTTNEDSLPSICDEMVDNIMFESYEAAQMEAEIKDALKDRQN